MEPFILPSLSSAPFSPVVVITIKLVYPLSSFKNKTLKTDHSGVFLVTGTEKNAGKNILQQ
jgi:hypothetical protein